MARSQTFTCPECDREHVVVIVQGETRFEDYAEGPESCESCGASFDNGPSIEDDAHAERRQMGIE